MTQETLQTLIVSLYPVLRAEEVGEGAVTAEVGVRGAEAPAAPGAPWRRARASTSLARFSSFSTIPASRSEFKTSAKKFRIQE